MTQATTEEIVPEEKETTIKCKASREESVYKQDISLKFSRTLVDDVSFLLKTELGNTITYQSFSVKILRLRFSAKMLLSNKYS